MRRWNPLQYQEQHTDLSQLNTVGDNQQDNVTERHRQRLEGALGDSATITNVHRSPLWTTFYTDATSLSGMNEVARRLGRMWSVEMDTADVPLGTDGKYGAFVREAHVATFKVSAEAMPGSVTKRDTCWFIALGTVVMTGAYFLYTVLT